MKNTKWDTRERTPKPKNKLKKWKWKTTTKQRDTRTPNEVRPQTSGCRSVSVGLIFPLFMSVVWICRLKLATHQASFNVFCYILLHARPVCHLLECFIGGLDSVVSCAWCIVCVCQHHPPLAVRYNELWRSEWLRDIRENTVSKMQHVLDRVERVELGGRVYVRGGNGMF